MWKAAHLEGQFRGDQGQNMESCRPRSRCCFFFAFFFSFMTYDDDATTVDENGVQAVLD